MMRLSFCFWAWFLVCGVGVGVVYSSPTESPTLSPTVSPFTQSPTQSPTFLPFTQSPIGSAFVKPIFISPRVDELLENVPDGAWDAAGIFGIVFGILFAFFGSKFLIFASFIFGFIIGIFVSAFVLSFIPQATGEVWLGVAAATGVIVGLFCACVAKSLKFVVGIVIGLVLAGVLIQFGLVNIIKDQVIVWVILGILVLMSGLIAYKFWKYAVIVCTGIVGGAAFMLGLARFTARDVISVYAIYGNPASLIQCSDAGCWGSFVGGISLAVLGISYQIWAERRRSNGSASSKSKISNKQKKLEEEEAQMTATEKQRAKDAAQKQEQEFNDRLQKILSNSAMEMKRIAEQTELTAERRHEEEKKRLIIAEEETRKLQLEREAATVRALELERELENLRRASSQPGAFEICEVHHVEFNICGCTNSRPRDQLVLELAQLRTKTTELKGLTETMEKNNEELRKELEKTATLAEEARIKAEKEAAELAQRQVEQEKMRLEAMLEESAKSRERVDMQVQELLGRSVAMEQELEILRGQVNEDRNRRQSSILGQPIAQAEIIRDSTGMAQNISVQDDEETNAARMETIASELEKNNNDVNRLKLEQASLVGLESELLDEVSILEDSASIIGENGLLPKLPPRPKAWKRHLNSENGEGSLSIPIYDENLPPPELPPRPRALKKELQSIQNKNRKQNPDKNDDNDDSVLAFFMAGTKFIGTNLWLGVKFSAKYAYKSYSQYRQRRRIATRKTFRADSFIGRLQEEQQKGLRI